MPYSISTLCEDPNLLGSLYQRLHHSIICYGKRHFGKSDGVILNPISSISRNIMELDNVSDTATDKPLKLMRTSAVTALFSSLVCHPRETDCRSSRLLRDFFTGVLFRLHARSFKYSMTVH